MSYANRQFQIGQHFRLILGQNYYRISRRIWIIQFYYLLIYIKCWITGKQCRPLSDGALCGVWSGSTLFTKVWMSKYLESIRYLSFSELIPKDVFWQIEYVYHIRHRFGFLLLFSFSPRFLLLTRILGTTSQKRAENTKRSKWAASSENVPTGV